MASEPRQEAAFAEVLALGSGTRLLRAIAAPGSVLLALVLFYLVVRAREHAPPTVAPPQEALMTVSLETLPPPPQAKPEPAPKAPAVHAPRASAPKPAAEELELAEVPEAPADEEAPDPAQGSVLTALPGAGGGFAGSGAAYGTAVTGGAHGHGKARTKARAARAVSYGWKCEWPSHRPEESAWVSLRVLVSSDGRPLVVETFDATAPPFAEVAKVCAQEQPWLPALDDDGHPLQAYTHVIKVFFTH
jgi:hypothetical protein